MSGGSFDYAYRHVEMFAEELEVRLEAYRENKSYHFKAYYGWEPDPLPEDIDKTMTDFLHHLAEVSHKMREIEWFFSGDTGEESFRERWERKDA